MMNKKQSLASFVAAAAAMLMFPIVAGAQQGPPPSSQPPPPPGGGGGMGGPPGPGPGAYANLWHPSGLTFGFEGSLGGMSNQHDDIACDNVDCSPIAGGFGANVGLQIGPRLSIRADLRAVAQPIASDNFDTVYLTQLTFMAVAQYWVSPRLWVAGGLGGATLSLDYDDGTGDSLELGQGGASMLGIGYEIVRSRPNRRRGRRPFSVDVNFRFTTGNYDGLGDTIYTSMVGIGIQWYAPRRVWTAPPPM